MRNSNYKLKLLYLLKILREYTDEDHGISMNEILVHLKEYGIIAERKSIYDDIEVLRQFGLDIIGEKRDRKYYYSLVNREFEVVELKLLVDAVQFSKFITEKKSRSLIEKLEQLTSRYNAGKLQRQVYGTGWSKTENEEIYYNIDKIHTAIENNVQIKFQYCQWTVEKKLEPKYQGKEYVCSPWTMIWDDENYYLLAFDNETQTIRNYRVDKMVKIKYIRKKRVGKDQFAKIDPTQYSKRVFSMYRGKEMNVKLRFHNQMAGVVIDRFGTDVNLIRADSTHFIVNVPVEVSDKFLAWIISMGDQVQVISPKTVIERLAEIGERLTKTYQK